jgi:hypothetical protein
MTWSNKILCREYVRLPLDLWRSVTNEAVNRIFIKFGSEFLGEKKNVVEQADFHEKSAQWKSHNT